MRVKKHENFAIPKKHFIFLGLLLIASQAGAYMANEFLTRNSYLIGYIVIFILGYGCLVFAMTFYKLYHFHAQPVMAKQKQRAQERKLQTIGAHTVANAMYSGI